MPARDVYHDAVVHALVADGWTITDDPYRLSYGGQELYVDLGAERSAIAAEKPGQKIAVEIKSFLSQSAISDFEEAVGVYGIYRAVLEQVDPVRVLFLAVPQRVYEDMFSPKFGQLIVKRELLKLVIFDEEQERITTWIP